MGGRGEKLKNDLEFGALDEHVFVRNVKQLKLFVNSKFHEYLNCLNVFIVFFLLLGGKLDIQNRERWSKWERESIICLAVFNT